MMDSFSYFRSYYEALKDVKKPATRLAIREAIDAYIFDGIEPAFSDSMASVIWKLLLPTLAKSKTYSDNKKGKTKVNQNEINLKSNQNQIKNKTKSNHNQMQIKRILRIRKRKRIKEKKRKKKRKPLSGLGQLPLPLSLVSLNLL